MTDPMDKFSDLLKNAPTLEINKFIENQTIDRAVAALEQKNASAHQGIGFGRRLMGTARMVLQPNDGAFMKKTYIAAGGLCAATLVIALLSTSSLTNEFRAFKQDVVNTKDALMQEKKAVPAPALSSMNEPTLQTGNSDASTSTLMKMKAESLHADKSAPMAMERAAPRSEERRVGKECA